MIRGKGESENKEVCMTKRIFFIKKEVEGGRKDRDHLEFRQMVLLCLKSYNYGPLTLIHPDPPRDLWRFKFFKWFPKITRLSI